MKINWRTKLSSRKLWIAVVSWITSVLTAFNITENTIAQVTVLIAGMGSLCVYMLAESSADKARASQSKSDEKAELNDD